MTESAPFVVLVTGGCRGIGRGTVEAALARGWVAVAADLSGADELPAGAEFEHCDVTDVASTERAVDAVIARHGRLDGVHANAGVPDWEPFLDMTAETYRKTMAVNLDGMFLTAQVAGRRMAAQGEGSIVLTSSVRSVATNSLHAAYGASKGATNSLVTALAVELGSQGIRVNGVLPGAIDTPMNRAAADLFFDGDMDALSEQMSRAIPMGRLGRSREVGEVVAFLLSPASSYVNGSLVRVDGGLLSTLTG
jgi:NAD(P)-dependent dehydrogenase (short-subunit alcohol dehydrogenase family)